MHTKDRKIDYASSNKTQIEQQSSIARGSQLPHLDPEMRLQQAAHILVTGAIRAVQKHKSEAKKRPEKLTKSDVSPMSENQTSDEIEPKSMPDLPTRKTCKRSHLGRTAEGEKIKSHT